MSERYLVTGAQLALLQELESKIERKQLIDEIVDKQFVGNSELSIVKDVKNVVLEKPLSFTLEEIK